LSVSSSVRAASHTGSGGSLCLETADDAATAAAAALRQLRLLAAPDGALDDGVGCPGSSPTPALTLEGTFLTGGPDIGGGNGSGSSSRAADASGTTPVQQPPRSGCPAGPTGRGTTAHLTTSAALGGVNGGKQGGVGRWEVDWTADWLCDTSARVLGRLDQVTWGRQRGLCMGIYASSGSTAQLSIAPARPLCCQPARLEVCQPADCTRCSTMNPCAPAGSSGIGTKPAAVCSRGCC
jgi:hypothetical protein